MSSEVDIKLTRDAYGLYDITFDSSGDFEKDSGFNTPLLRSLYGERRADSGEVSESSKRRGWWGNELATVENFEEGSKLWLLEQARVRQDTANRAITYAEDCLEWLIEDKHYKQVNVNGNLNSAETGEIEIQIALIASNDAINTKSYTLITGEL